MECPYCGASASEKDRFCPECGRPLAEENPPGQSAGPVQVQDQAAGLPPPPTAPKRRIPLLILLVILGTVALLLLYLGAGKELVRWVVEGRLAADPGQREPAAASLLYVDGFEGPDSGWDTFDDGNTAAGYVDGEYRLAIYGANTMAWSNPNPGVQLNDAVIVVDARQVEGPLRNNFGLLVRYQVEEENFYWFQISGDGLYAVYRKQADEWVPLVEWTASAAIRQGLGTTNRLKVVCTGNRFSFYVNELHLADLTDDTLPTGNVGLGAGSFDQPGVIVHFDNLGIYAVEE